MRLRITNSLRSNAASRSPATAGAGNPGPRPISTCRNTGWTATALGPSALLSVGTSRQPMRRCPSSATIRSNSSTIAARLSAWCGRKTSPAPYRARFRQLPAEPAGFLAQEAVRHLNQDAGAVAGVDFTAAGAAVFEVDEHLQGLPDDRVRPASLHVRHEPDAAGVVLMSRVIQALRGGIVVLMHASFMNEELS